MTLLQDLAEEHDTLMEEEHSSSPDDAKVVPYVENWLRHNPEKITMAYLNTIGTLNHKDRVHILTHLEARLRRKKRGFKPEFKAPALGPFGAGKVPLVPFVGFAPVSVIRIFKRQGFPLAQPTVRGRFARGGGPTTHDLRKLGTFLRKVERSRE